MRTPQERRDVWVQMSLRALLADHHGPVPQFGAPAWFDATSNLRQAATIIAATAWAESFDPDRIRANLAHEALGAAQEHDRRAAEHRAHWDPILARKNGPGRDRAEFRRALTDHIRLLDAEDARITRTPAAAPPPQGYTGGPISGPHDWARSGAA